MTDQQVTDAGDPVALRAKVKTLHEALITTDAQLKEARLEIERLQGEINALKSTAA